MANDLPLRLIVCCLITIISTLSFAKVRNFEHQRVPNQFIIKFKDDGVSSSKPALLRSQQFKVLHRFEASGAYLVEVANQKSSLLSNQEFKSLAQDERVEYIEANTIVRALMEPNDPDFSKQYGLKNTGQTEGQQGADISAVSAWDIQTGSKDVLVAVIDTGVDYNHNDLKDNMWTNPGESGVDAAGKDKKTNGVDDDSNGFVDDWHGWDFVNYDNDPLDDNTHRHGSHVSGIIGAKSNNAFGISGVNWDVSIVGLKFLSGSGSGSLADAVKAIEYATKLGVKLSSNSWGGGGYSEAMVAAIQAASDKGILFIAAAGNDSSNADTMPMYPAAYRVKNVISVAASDHKDELASFSNYGIKTVHLAAPGNEIYSIGANNSFALLSGTSMATPFVSGAAALLYAQYPEMSMDNVKTRLIYSVDRKSALLSKVLSGGRLNLVRSIETDLIAPGKVNDIRIVDTTQNSIKINWQLAGDDQDQGYAAKYEVRYADKSIDTEEDWNQAKIAEIVPIFDAAFDQVGVALIKLPLNYSGHLNVKAVDNVGNVGALSINTPFKVTEVNTLLYLAPENLDNVTVEGEWALKSVAQQKVFADSPDGEYKNNVNASLTLDPVKITGKNAKLLFYHSYALESGYDFGYVEVLGSDSQWKTVKTFSGSLNTFDLVEVELDSYLSGLENAHIRFRIKTDYDVTADGWHIYGVSVIADR